LLGAKQENCFGINQLCPLMSLVGTIEAPELPSTIPSDAQWLLGQGAGTWFAIATTEKTTEYKIRRYTPTGSLDCDRLFVLEDNGSIFDISIPYEFAHVSHCAKCRIKQGGIIFIFNYIKD
jgi:hypothetical protein